MARTIGTVHQTNVAKVSASKKETVQMLRETPNKNTPLLSFFTGRDTKHFIVSVTRQIRWQFTAAPSLSLSLSLTHTPVEQPFVSTTNTLHSSHWEFVSLQPLRPARTRTQFKHQPIKAQRKKHLRKILSLMKMYSI